VLAELDFEGFAEQFMAKLNYKSAFPKHLVQNQRVYLVDRHGKCFNLERLSN